MIDDGESESELERNALRGARRSFAPSRADEERVRAGVARLVAVAPVAAPNGHDETVSGQVGEAAGRWFSKLALGAALVAGGGVGYVAGYRAGVERGRANDVAESAPLVVPPTPRTDEPSAALPRAPVVPDAPPEPGPSRGVAPAKSSSNVVNGPDGGLDEEVRLLKRIERALRDENPRYALGLLGELERTVPGGQLVEERHAAKVMAGCQLVGGSQAMIDEFSKAHPGSAYATRVTQTCRGAAGQRNPEEPDTHR